MDKRFDDIIGFFLHHLEGDWHVLDAKVWLVKGVESSRPDSISLSGRGVRDMLIDGGRSREQDQAAPQSAALSRINISLSLVTSLE